MSFENQTTGKVAAGQTVLDNQAVVYTGAASQEVRPAAAGEEAQFAGFAAYGGAAGELILITKIGTDVPFIPDGGLTPVSDGAPLKLANGGELALAAGGEDYVARYTSKAIWGGQGGDLALGTSDNVSAGQTGFCTIERGVA